MIYLCRYQHFPVIYHPLRQGTPEATAHVPAKGLTSGVLQLATRFNFNPTQQDAHQSQRDGNARGLTDASVIEGAGGGRSFKDQTGDVAEPILRHTRLNHNHRNGCWRTSACR